MPPTPDGPNALALVHEGWDHLRRERPLAAWAIWQRALRINPDQAAAKQALERLANAADLPASARQEYRFRAPSDPARRARWDAAFRGRDLSDLSEAASAFASLAVEDPADSDAPYNQGLCLAWLGRNREAIEALSRSIRRQADADFEAAVRSGVLIEVLLAAPGADVEPEWSTDAVDLEGIDDPASIVDEIGRRANLRRLPSPVDPTVDPSRAGLVVAEILDRPWPEPSKAPLALDDLPRVDAVVLATGQKLRFSWVRGEGHDAVHALLDGLGLAMPLPIRTALPLAMLDAPIWTIRLPDWADEETRRRLYRENVEDFYENRWVMSHGLESGKYHPAVRARAEARIRLREELAARPAAVPLYQGYPFDRLRHRVGLEPSDPAAVDPVEIGFMTAAELDALDPAMLDDAALAEAVRSSLPFHEDARVARFAAPLVEKKAPALAHFDLGSVFYCLIDPAIEAGRLDEAERWVDRGIELDEALRGGRDRDDFEFWRARLLALRGRSDEALAIFEAIFRRGRWFDMHFVEIRGCEAAEVLRDAGHAAHAREFLSRALGIVRDRGDAEAESRLKARLRSIEKLASG